MILNELKGIIDHRFPTPTFVRVWSNQQLKEIETGINVSKMYELYGHCEITHIDVIEGMIGVSINEQ